MSDSVTISGGASRITSGFTALTSSPRRRAAASTAPACSPASCRPHHSPLPRTPITSGLPMLRRPCSSRAPVLAALASRPSRSMVSSTANAAAQATGLPPKVLPWLPGVNSAAASPKPMQAPIGRPPPRPFASVSTSGWTPAACPANQSPVRPMPLCTSSSTSRAPASVQIRRAAAR